MPDNGIVVGGMAFRRLYATVSTWGLLETFRDLPGHAQLQTCLGVIQQHDTLMLD